jgi:hypothetical protein
MTTFPTARPAARVLAFLALAAAFTACKGFTAIDPSFQNVTADDTVFAINNGPANSPNSINFFQGFVSRADQGFAFDIAFDIDENGNVILIPARALSTTFATPYTVALQRVDGPFETILAAPKDGYRPDTAMTVSVGQTVVAESQDIFGTCAFALKGQSYYSKIVINEVDPALRRIVFTVTVDRNCGFHSFEPGLPRD